MDGQTRWPRLLGLDIGSKRIGVAVSDELGLLAQPVLTLYRKRQREDVRSLARLARRYGCAGIVAGNPLQMAAGQSGEAGAQAVKVQMFAREVAAYCGLPLTLWDERLTSREAHALLYAAGKPRQEHGAVVDQVAAVLILQGYLDWQRAGGATGDGVTGAEGPEKSGAV
jgi:putative Holliday junction resolvase